VKPNKNKGREEDGEKSMRKHNKGQLGAFIARTKRFVHVFEKKKTHSFNPEETRGVV
jgi:hypothetical protein